MKRVMAIWLLALLCSYAHAQRKNWVKRNLDHLAAFIDTMSTKGHDPQYLLTPKKPWQVILRFNANDMHITSKTDLTQLVTGNENNETHEVLKWNTTISPSPSTSLGAWVGYRGYGLGYSFSINKQKGRNLNFSATGSSYSLSLKLRRFETYSLDVNLKGLDEDGEDFDINFSGETYDPITVHSTLINGFYMLNSKRFSHAAAYDQSIIQLRSAGSIVVGAAWFHTSLDYGSDKNGGIIQSMNNIGYAVIDEGSLCVGYAYNWVPAKNLLVNMSVMPLFTVYNKTKATIYDCNYDAFLDPDEPSTNGKKPFPYDDSWIEDIEVTPKEEITRHGNISVNLDSRLSLTYQMGNYFINIFGQYNYYHHHIGSNKTHISDWQINGSLGIRL